MNVMRPAIDYNRIKNELVANNITQRVLADRLDECEPTVNRKLNGKRQMYAWELIVIAQITNRPVEFFLI